MYQSPARRRTSVRQERNRRRHLSLVLGSLIMAVLGAAFMILSGQLADHAVLSSFTSFMGIAYILLATVLVVLTFIDILDPNA